MSNNVNANNNKPLDPAMAAVKELERLMMNGGTDVDAEPEEESLKVQDITLEKDELILFKDAEDSAYQLTEIIERSELNNTVLNILKDLFADISSVSLKFSADNHWVFDCVFMPLTEEQIASVKADRNNNNLTTAFTRSVVDLGNSVAGNILELNRSFNIANSSVDKYLKLNQDAKVFLSTLLWYNPKINPKKKWIKGGNFDIIRNTANGFNNILGIISLDAEKVVSMLSCSIETDADGNKTSDNRTKYTFSIKESAYKINNNDALIEVTRNSKKRMSKLSSKYGINFTNR